MVLFSSRDRFFNSTKFYVFCLSENTCVLRKFFSDTIFCLPRLIIPLWDICHFAFNVLSHRGYIFFSTCSILPHVFVVVGATASFWHRITLCNLAPWLTLLHAEIETCVTTAISSCLCFSHMHILVFIQRHLLRYPWLGSPSSFFVQFPSLLFFFPNCICSELHLFPHLSKSSRLQNHLQAMRFSSHRTFFVLISKGCRLNIMPKPL